nr:hypothetical protein [uncultured Vibrio sp.]
MVQPIFDFIEKFATDFSWRRLVIFFSLLVLIGFSFFFYESQTFNNQLSAYERAVTLLEKTSKLKHEDPLAQNVIKNIHSGLVDITERSSLDSGLDVTVSKEFKQALAGGALWAIAALAFLPSVLSGNRNDDHHAVIGCVIFALITGTGGYFLPTDWSAWVVYGLYPVGLNLLLFIVLALIGNRGK